MKLSQTQYSRDMEQATDGFLLWQMALNTLNTFLPTNSSSPSTKKPISLGLQCLVMAMWILGTAVICFLFVISTTLLARFLFFFRKCLMSAVVLSVEASSTMTTRQLLQSWLKMDCRLYSYLKFLALLKLGTMIQKGSSVVQSLKWYVSSNLVSSFCSSSSICLRSMESMKGVLMLARSIIHGLRFFSGLKQSPLTSSSNFSFLVCLTISLALFSSRSIKTDCSQMVFSRSSMRSAIVISSLGFLRDSSKWLSPSCSKRSRFLTRLVNLEKSSVLMESSSAFSLLIFLSILPISDEMRRILSRVSLSRISQLVLLRSMLKSLNPRRVMRKMAQTKTITWILFLELNWERNCQGQSIRRKFILVDRGNIIKSGIKWRLRDKTEVFWRCIGIGEEDWQVRGDG